MWGDRFGSTEQNVSRAIQELKASMRTAVFLDAKRAVEDFVYHSATGETKPTKLYPIAKSYQKGSLAFYTLAASGNGG